jgi:hypothetical protein
LGSVAVPQPAASEINSETLHSVALAPKDRVANGRWRDAFRFFIDRSFKRAFHRAPL